VREFGAFAITYNRPSILIETLDAIFRQTVTPERVLIVDNGASDATRVAVEAYGREEIRYVAMEENLGPAGGAAYGLNALANEGYKYILWIDDDDPPSSPDALERLLAIFRSANGRPVGAVGCMGSRINWRTGKFVRLEDDDLRGILEVDYIPGGGLPMVSSEAIASVGVPDERIFFGFEDMDYCIRLKKEGFRLLIDGDMFLNRRFAWRRIKHRIPRSIVRLRDHSQIWRSYYSTRNYIWIMNRKCARPDLAAREVGRALVRAALGYRRGWRYGCAHLKMQRGAIIDGYLGRTGRRIVPDTKK
jgi:GT2 family glycosyltransferase